MAHLSEILEKEKQRTNDAECRVIHLFPEGTFYRAYQWSAWLCSRYISQFKPTRRQIKNTEDYLVFVGFPTASLSKFVPDGIQPIVNEDKTVDIRIPELLVPAIESSEPFLTDYQNWMMSVPLTEPKTKDKTDKVTDFLIADSTNTKDILKKILSYPIEQKTPIDSMLFLTDLRRQVAAII